MEQRPLPKLPRSRKLFLSFPLGILVLLGLLRIALFLPAVQSWLVYQAKGFLEERLGARVEITGVDFALPDRAQLEGLTIYDQQDQKWLQLGELDISVFAFSLWDLIFEREEVQNFALGRVLLDEADIFLYRRKQDSSLNIQFIIDSLKPQNSSGEPILLNLAIENLFLKNSKLTYRDSISQKIDILNPGHLNWTNLQLSRLNSVLAFTRNPKGKITLDVTSLSLREERSGFPVQSLTSLIEIVPADSSKEQEAFVEARQLDLRSDRSQIKGTVRLPGATLRKLFDTKFDEQFTVELKNSQFDIATINYLSPREIPIGGLWKVHGSAEGTLSHLRLNTLQIELGDSTHFALRGQLFDLLQTDKAKLDLNISEGHIGIGDLHEVLGQDRFPKELAKVRQMDLLGTFKGGYFDFDVAGSLGSNLGNIDFNLNLQLPPVSKMLTYEGKLTTKNLDINSLLGDGIDVSRELNFDGTIAGKGSNLHDLDTKIDASILQSRLMGYNLDSLYLDVKVAERQLKGTIFGMDGQGLADLKLDLDWKHEPAKYQASGRINRLNAKTYGLYSQEILLSSGLNIDLIGDSLDGLQGQVILQQALLERPADTSAIRVPDLYLRADNLESQKYINLKSSLMDADLAGDFSVHTIGPLLKRLFVESRLFLQNDDSLIQEYYANKAPDSLETHLLFGVAARDSLNQIFDFLNEPIFVSSGSLVSGEISFGLNEQFSILLQDSDSILFPGGRLVNPYLSIDLFKRSDQNKLAAAGEVRLDTVQVGPRFELQDVDINIQGVNNRFESDLVFHQGEDHNEAQLKLTTAFFENGYISTSIDSAQSFLVFRGDSLLFSEGDSLIVGNGVYDIRNLMIQDSIRYIRLDGLIAKDKEFPLKLSLGGISLNILDDLFPLIYQPTGLINAELEMYSLLYKPVIKGVSRIDSFALDGYAYGDVYSKVSWSQGDGNLALRSSLWDGVDTTLTLAGNYATKDEKSPLDFDILSPSGGFPLNYAYPFVKTTLSVLEGKVNLQAFKLFGSFKDLVVSGTGQFADARFGIDYFRTDYRFNGEINFDNDRITFPRIKLYDQYDHTAEFHGTIRHRGLREFDFSLQLDQMRNFLIMDTQKGDNDLFYGRVFARNGIADISGDLNNLVVTAFATSGSGSNLKIPISDYNEFERPEYIRFTGDDELDAAKNQTGLKGFELNLTTVVTEDIEIEMIFDERVGDIMRGRGAGTLTMEINTEGEFNMSGDYEIQDGDYLFTAQSVVNKKFIVKPGGRLSWTGDPYAAEMDIEAYYPVSADIKDILQSSQSQRIPVSVLMHLEGDLMQPEIGLSIELPNLNNQNASELLSYLRTIQYDEQELNKQVFSLMVFRRFAPIGGFGENLATTGISSSVSELISNQFNYWLSQATSDKLNVNVGSNNFQDVSLLVSYKLFNDRVTIERDGTLIGGSNNSNLSVGNLRVIIRLLPKPESIEATTQSSELVVEVFRREALETNPTSLLKSTSQTGIGLFYKRDFDSLGEFIGSNKAPKVPKTD
ncbi:MAG: translocation/assembly module TamB domain-containing protein [Bacteroidia bacterium]